jgi:hypothetical protein
MSTQKDDLEAVRTIVETIKDFNDEEQRRIFRWAAEKLGLPQPSGSVARIPAPEEVDRSKVGGAHAPPPQRPPATEAAPDIKSFVLGKKPRNDVQFAATVAYYYRFEAQQAERKDSIDPDVLQEATRLVGRQRFADPRTTLNNAQKLGLLDRGSDKGTFAINSVGENLVAMTLPDGASIPKAAKKRVAKKPAKKSAAKKAKKA